MVEEFSASEVSDDRVRQAVEGLATHSDLHQRSRKDRLRRRVRIKAISRFLTADRFMMFVIPALLAVFIVLGLLPWGILILWRVVWSMFTS